MKKSRSKMAKIVVRKASRILSKLKGEPSWISAGGGTIHSIAGALSKVSGCNYEKALSILQGQGWTSERLDNWLDNCWGLDNVATLHLPSLMHGKVWYLR